jgi:hypothetical protein
MTETELKTEIENLKKENASLRKRLEKTDFPFDKQLSKRVDSKLHELTFAIGESIAKTAGQNIISCLKNKKIVIDYWHSSYGKGGYYIRFLEEKDVNEIKDYMAELELKKFQESLDNFSWAIQKQNN